jgi:hypothetical protein
MKEKLTQWLKFVWTRIKTPLIYIGVICIIVGIAYIAGRCSTKQERKVAIDNLIAARDSVKHSYITIGGLENQVFEMNAVILSKDDAIKSGFLEQERLKKLHIKELITNVELKGRIKILEDSLDLPPNVEYITVKDSSGVTKDYIRYPFVLLNIHRKDSVDLIAGLNKNRQAYWKLDIPFSAEMSVGYQKDGFLKTKPVGIFTTTNPYVKIDKMDVVIVKKSEKWFQKWYTPVGIYAVGREIIRLILRK